jgi:F0F1-type ATP synthase assembly protein I
MPVKKGGAKLPDKPAKKKKTAAKKAVVKKQKALEEIILHEEWPKTESLMRSEEKHGILLDPERELAAKPEFAEIIDEKQAAPSNGQTWWVPAVSVFARLSGWLLAPLILGVTLGKWLDKKYDSAPWLFLITIGVAFLVSMYGLITNTIEAFKKIEKSANNNNESTNSVGKFK